MEERKLDLEKQIDRLAKSIGWIDSECNKMDKDKNSDPLKYPDLLNKRLEAEELMKRYKKELEQEKLKKECEPISEEDILYKKADDTYTFVRSSYIRLKDN